MKVPTEPDKSRVIHVDFKTPPAGLPDGLSPVETVRGRKFDPQECKHARQLFDGDHHLLECKDCGKQLDPLTQYMRHVEETKRLHAVLDRKRDDLRNLAEKKTWIKAVGELSRLWRGPKRKAAMCPHCGGGILPGDGLGRNWLSEDVELKRRAGRGK